MREGGRGDPKRVRGQSYHPAHVSRLLKKERLRACTSLSARPTSGTKRRSNAGKRSALARANKEALEEGRTILFAKQSGFYLLPCAVRTYAPVGQTPYPTRTIIA